MPWKILVLHILFLFYLNLPNILYFNNTFIFKPLFDNYIVYFIIFLLLSIFKFCVILNLTIFIVYKNFFF